MVADPISAAELPVGIVIGHAPAKAASDPLLGNAVVQHSGQPQRLGQPVGLVIKGFGRELPSPEFADLIAFAHIRRHRSAGGAAGAVP